MSDSVLEYLFPQVEIIDSFYRIVRGSMGQILNTNTLEEGQKGLRSVRQSGSLFSIWKHKIKIVIFSIGTENKKSEYFFLLQVQKEFPSFQKTHIFIILWIFFKNPNQQNTTIFKYLCAASKDLRIHIHTHTLNLMSPILKMKIL